MAAILCWNEKNNNKAVWDLTAAAKATTVAKGVTKDVVYFNAWWHDNPAVAVAKAKATNSHTALDLYQEST